MDTNFLSNPINVGIITGGILTIMMIILYMVKNGLLTQVGKSGVQFQSAEQAMTNAIPRIDLHMKESLRALLNNYKESLLGSLNSYPSNVRLFVLKSFLEEFRNRIWINHFSLIMSNYDALNKWLNIRVDVILRNSTYAFDYCEIQVNDINTLKDKLSIISTEIIDLFSESVINACYEKIAAYNNYPNDAKCKKLIEKNQQYITDITNTLIRLRGHQI